MTLGGGKRRKSKSRSASKGSRKRRSASKGSRKRSKSGASRKSGKRSKSAVKALKREAAHLGYAATTVTKGRSGSRRRRSSRKSRA